MATATERDAVDRSIRLTDLARRVAVDEALIRNWIKTGIVAATVPGRSTRPDQRRRFSPMEASAVTLVARARALGIQPHKMTEAVRWFTAAPWTSGWRGWLVLGTDGRVYSTVEERADGTVDVTTLALQIAQFPSPGFALVRAEVPEGPLDYGGDDG